MMRSSYFCLALVLALGVGGAALAQEDGKKDDGSAAPSDAPKDGEKAADSEAKSEEDKGGYAGYTDTEGRNEEYWTTTMGGARDKLLTIQKEIDRIDFEEAALQNEFYAKDDPYQREKTKGAWDDMLDRRATMQAELEAAQKEVDELTDEGRRTGALPGWLRETSAQEQAREEFETREPVKGATHQVDLDKLADDNKKADEAIYGKEEDEDSATSSEEAAAAAEEKAEADEEATDDEPAEPAASDDEAADEDQADAAEEAETEDSEEEESE